jgi:D-threo-aldose 1-dehydrogenase
MKKLSIKSQLGTTGVEISPIIFGTSALGNLYKALPDDQKLSIISNWFKYIESPVVIDTAGKYGAGLALEVIGNGLRSLNIDPKDIIISNKLGWLRKELTTPAPTFEPGVWVNLKYDAVQNISYDGIVECYHQGIELLGGDYGTEILSVHDPDEYLNAANDPAGRNMRMDDILGAYRALEDLKQKGDASAIGVGSKDWRAIKLIAEEVSLDWVMLATEYTIMDHPKDLIDFVSELDERGISVINSAVFHGGFLTGGEFYNYRHVDRNDPGDQNLFEWRDKFYRHCGNYNILPADACMMFGISHPGIDSIALNTSRPEVIEHNVNLIQQKINPEFWQDLKNDGLIEISYKYV